MARARVTEEVISRVTLTMTLEEAHGLKLFIEGRRTEDVAAYIGGRGGQRFENKKLAEGVTSVFYELAKVI